MTTIRKATYWATYRGVIAADHFTRGYVGPNLNGEQLYPVEFEYDGKLDKTRVGFSLIAPAPEQVSA